MSRPPKPQSPSAAPFNTVNLTSEGFNGVNYGINNGQSFTDIMRNNIPATPSTPVEVTPQVETQPVPVPQTQPLAPPQPFTFKDALARANTNRRGIAK